MSDSALLVNMGDSCVHCDAAVADRLARCPTCSGLRPEFRMNEQAVTRDLHPCVITGTPTDVRLPNGHHLVAVYLLDAIARGWIDDTLAYTQQCPWLHITEHEIVMASQKDASTLRPRKCPRCRGHKVAEVRYGLLSLDEEQCEELDGGQVVLGGCTVFPDSSKWLCHKCNHTWGKLDCWRALEPDSVFRLVEQARIKDNWERLQAEHRARGPVPAKINRFEAVQCPGCGSMFDTRYRSEWDGEKHVRCGILLSLTRGP